MDSPYQTLENYSFKPFRANLLGTHKLPPNSHGFPFKFVMA